MERVVYKMENEDNEFETEEHTIETPNMDKIKARDRCESVF